MTRPVLTLALDASASLGTVAVLDGARLLAADTVPMRGEAKERLLPAIAGALAKAGCGVQDVRRVVCGAGPGSFTSLRVAAAIAKGVALGNSATSHETPLFSVSSLALIVAGAESLSPGRYLALLDAMRQERYAALFELNADLVVVAGKAMSTGRLGVDDVAAVAARHAAIAIGPEEVVRSYPHARGVARLVDVIERSGPVSLDAWEPDYGRLAEAQVQWETRHGRSLSREGA